MVELHSGRTDPAIWFALHQCGLLIYEVIIAKLGKGENADEMRRLLPLAVSESNEGAMFSFQRLNVIGQKPFGPRSARQSEQI